MEIILIMESNQQRNAVLGPPGIIKRGMGFQKRWDDASNG